MDRFCKDCRHFIPDTHSDGKCAALSDISRVTGKRSFRMCAPERSLGVKCGEEGKLFQPVFDEQVAS